MEGEGWFRELARELSFTYIGVGGDARLLSE